jgi:Ni,Fe-hydrogenase I cytochrome b subunit
MSRVTRIYAAVLLLTMLTIEFGGYFLLRILSGFEGEPHPITFALFRAGHAHAGVLVLLTLVILLYVEHASYPSSLRHVVRILFAAAPILMSAGFFAGGGGLVAGRPGAGIAMTYVGAISLASGLVFLSLGLLKRSPMPRSTQRI